METTEKEQKIMALLLEDRRYGRSAYDLVSEALDYTKDRKHGPNQRGHITPKELLEGTREFAREQFGMLANLVLRKLGIKESIDIGNIVFNLVKHDFIGRTSEDSIEDFRDAYNGKSLSEAFNFEIDEITYKDCPTCRKPELNVAYRMPDLG